MTQTQNSTLISSYAYTLDNAGNRLQVDELNGISVHWQYDDLYRLTEEKRASGGVTVYQANYTYNTAGNRSTQTVNSVTTTYTYNNLDQLTSDGTLTYTYDGRGNLIETTDGIETTTYTFNAQARLVGVELPDGSSAIYDYDADGRHVSLTIGTTTTKYLWDETSTWGDVILETDSNGNPLVSYVLGNDQLISQTRNGITSYYLPDGQGNVRALTNQIGSLTDTYNYTAFGALYNQQGGTNNPYLYAGQRLDTFSDLYGMRARYYDPDFGRFLSRDTYAYDYQNPIEFNRYLYTAHNPVNRMDPSGHSLIGTALTTARNVLDNIPGASAVGHLTSSFVVRFLSVLIVTLNIILAATYKAEDNTCTHVGYHGSSSENTVSLIQGVKLPPSSENNFGGNSQLGGGFYVTPDLKAAETFADIAVRVRRENHKNPGKPRIFQVCAYGFNSMTHKEVPEYNATGKVWWNEIETNKYIHLDYVTAPIDGYRHWRQIKFNPRAFGSIRILLY